MVDLVQCLGAVEFWFFERMSRFYPAEKKPPTSALGTTVLHFTLLKSSPWKPEGATLLYPEYVHMGQIIGAMMSFSFLFTVAFDLGCEVMMLFFSVFCRRRPRRGVGGGLFFILLGLGPCCWGFLVCCAILLQGK